MWPDSLLINAGGALAVMAVLAVNLRFGPVPETQTVVAE